MAEKKLPRFNHLHSDRTSFTTTSPKTLAQSEVANATASGCQPPQQSTAAATTQPQFKNGVPITNLVVGQNLATQNPSTSTVDVPLTKAPSATPAVPAVPSAPEGSKLLKPPPTQSTDSNAIDGLRFTALDQFLVETPKMYDAVSGTFQWEMCEADEARCLSFIREQAPTKRVFIITSGSQGKSLVPIVHNLPQVYAIYIHCANMDYHREWSAKFEKVRVLCNDDEELFPQMAVDVAQANLEWGNTLMKQGDKAQAQKKYQKALKNLTEFTKKRHDPAMEKEVQKKLEECK